MIATLLLATGLLTACSAERPNILIITLDTTRADRLGFNGYARGTSPNLDTLAAESVIYTQALSTASTTLPAHASLFTGKFTTSHGARRDPTGPLRLLDAIEGPEAWEVYRARGLSRGETTLAGLLAEAGYSTGAVVAGPWLKRIFSLDEGFEFYDDSGIGSVNGRSAESVTAGAVAWLEQQRESRFFLFLNYFDPHGPYTPPDEFLQPLLADIAEPREPAEVRRARYDAEIRYMDHHIGELIRKLEEWDLYDDTWIIVTADHGELLGEHEWWGHGKHLYQEELHIALLSKYPGGALGGTSVDSWVQLTDILPLICDRLDLSVPSGIQGSVPPDLSHPIIAETYPPPPVSPDGEWRTLIEGDFKFLWSSKGRHQLFNLAEDPRESIDLAARKPRVAAEMLARLEQYLAGLPGRGDAGPPVQVDEETTEALKGLGYVE